MPFSLRGSITRNAVWNLFGLTAPVAVSLGAFPILIDNLGNERFGLLAVIWALIGYAGLVDLGLPRSLTHAVARAIGSGTGHSWVPVGASGLACLACIGVIAGGILVLVSGPIANAIDVSGELRDELRVALLVGGMTLPLVLLNAGLLGILEAIGKFNYSNLCRIVVATITVSGAALASLWYHWLWIGVLSMAASRVLAVLLAGQGVYGVSREAIPWAAVSWSRMRVFLVSSRWMTASSLLGIILAYGDKLVLLVAVPAAALAWYVTPFEIVTKLLILATAVGGAVFPAFALSHVDRPASRQLFARAVYLIVVSMLPLVVLGIGLAEPALALWISPEFSGQSSGIAQVLCVGVFCNGIAAVPLSYLQAVGRARTVAAIHGAEAPIYAVALIWAALVHGVTGVAFAWTIRVSLDLLLLLVAAVRALSGPRPAPTAAR